MVSLNTTSPEPTRFFPVALLHHLYDQFRQNLVLVLFCAGMMASSFIASTIMGAGFEHPIIAYLRRALFMITPLVFAAFFIGRLLHVTFIQKPPTIMKAVALDLWSAASQPERYARMVWFLLVPSMGFIAFANFKVYIPEIIPFYADDILIQIERTIHFGTLPHDRLAFILEMPSVVGVIDIFYKLWFFVGFLLWGWAAWGAEDAGWRRQFILSYMLCWGICGILLATLMSSVGPVFYDALVASNGPYTAYMAQLGEVHKIRPLMAVEIQKAMTELHLTQPPSGRIGISAMPSLHNTLAFLFVIAGYRIHRIVGHLMAAFAAVIFIGSIVLGWHYALDGYAGLILAIAMWKLAGWLLKVQDKALRLDPASIQ